MSISERIASVLSPVGRRALFPVLGTDDPDWPFGYGYCHCGCGLRTKPATRTHASRGLVKGEPVRFRRGHHKVRYVGPEFEEDPETGCWVWQRCISPFGYAVGWRPSDGQRNVHRIYYEEFIGPIPEGLSLDHLCRNRACVNPGHLEPVTHRENVHRGLIARGIWKEEGHGGPLL